MRFANKLSLSVTAVAFVVVPLLGFVISNAERDIASKAIVNQQMATVQHLTGDIEQVLMRAERDIRVISEDAFLLKFLLSSGATFTDEARQDMAREFRERGRVTGPWYGVMAFRGDGTIMLSTFANGLGVGMNIDEFAAGRAVYQTVLRGAPYRSGVLTFDATGRLTVALAVPVVSADHAKVIGAVVGYFDWSAILRVLDQTDASSRAYLVNRDGLVVATLSRDQRRILHERLPRDGFLGAARSGKAASGTITLDRGGEPLLATAMAVGGYDKDSPTDWILVLATPLHVVFAPVDEMTRNIVIGVSATMLAMVVLFYSIGRRLAGPVEHLTDAVTGVGAGKLDTRVRVEGDDEVSTLAMAFNDMTEELRRQREELNATKSFLESIVNTSAGVIFTIDPQGRFEFVNERGLALTGYTRDEVLQQPFLELISPNTRATVMADFEAVLGGATVYTHEAAVIRRDGTARWLEYSAAPLMRDGRIVRIVGTAADINDRKQAALLIEASEHKLRAVLDATTEGIMMVDAQTRKTVLANRAICDMLGYSPEEFAALGVDDIHPAADLSQVLRQFERQLRGEIKVATDTPVLRKDGSVFFADISTSTMTLGGQKMMLGAFHDITERKEAEETLRKSEERFRSLVESTSDMVWEVDQNGVYTYVSPRIHALLGYAPEEILGKTPFDLMPPQEAQRVAGDFGRLIAARQPIRALENTNRHKDGHLVVIETSGLPFFLPDGRLGGYRGIDRDITERIRSRRELEFKNTLLATQQETSPDGILVVDAQAKILYYNRRFVEIWGIPRELVEARDDEPVLKLVVDRQSDPVAFLARVRYLYEHRQESSHEELALSDGKTVDRYSAPMFGADGTYYGRVWYFRDITERKRSEAIIKASLAEKEALLREVHHRVKNNLQVVISLLNLEAGKIADPAVLHVLRDAQRRIEVMALVHEKLHRSRELAEVDAKSYIEDLARSAFHAQERGGAEVRLALAVEPVGLNLDAATPCGLIVNELISNALKYAFPDARGGEIHVALRAADDGAVELAVGDDGVGMPADFDWRGSKTLGLRLVRNLVERQLQGRLDLERNQGTEWKIRFAA